MGQQSEHSPYYYQPPPEYQRPARSKKKAAIILFVVSWAFWIASLVFLSFYSSHVNVVADVGFFAGALGGCAAQGAGFVFLLLIKERQSQ